MSISQIIDLVAAAREKGLTSLNQCALVLHLHTSGPALMHEVATAIGHSPGCVTDLADRLEKLGFITRTRDRLDRRKYHLALTPLGQSTAKSIEALNHFPASEPAVLSAP